MSTARHRAIPLALGVAAFALALLQRPGWASSDTKIDLHVAPARFLADVASVWTSTGSLGHVQGGQYSGYLWPMGPWFALGHAVGLSPWLAQRLWLGALLAAGCWGTVRLLDALLDERRGLAHAVAGAMVLLNPYVVVFSGRTSITLLGYALLPWLLLAVHRGVRVPRSWWWPAAFALLLASTGGGVNAAVTAWVLIGPLLLLFYEPLVGGVPWAAVRRFALRGAVTTAGVSVWWVVPVLVQSLYGIDFLKFTEQPGTIWGTTSLTESLRLMGYWLSYIGVGFTGALHPYFDDSPTLLFSAPVLLATLVVPALALGGFVWTRRWRYGPFFVLLTLVGLAVMVAGFPNGTPLRRALYFVYNRVDAVQFLRTTYKAAPLVALGLACLGGVAAREALVRLRAARTSAPALAGLGALAAVALALAAWPFFAGRAVDRQLEWKRIPAAWRDAARDLDRTLPRNTRAVVLPGQLFAAYRWGGTVDPILPALSERPVAVRNVVPYADLHAVDALWTADSLVGQERALPGQLEPLLGLLGAGAVVSATDDDRARSGGPNPDLAAEVLAGQGLARPDRAYGPVRSVGPPAGELAAPRRLPQVRRYDLPTGRGLVRVEPAGPPLVLDGSAQGVADLASFGALPARAPLEYAGDRSAADLRAAARRGGEVVVSDSNRRRVFVAARLEQNVGATLAASDPVPKDAAVLDPFPARGTDGQTVAVYEGARYVRSLVSPGFSLFPEHRAYAAFDGSASTAWLADRNLTPAQRWVEIGFDAPRDVDHIDLLPHGDARSVVESVEVNGRRHPVHAGWNRLRLRLRGVGALRIRIARARFPQEPGGGGGLAEVRIPGVRVRELLRPPVLAERALAGVDLRRAPLTYLFERTTGDSPLRRASVTGPVSAQALRDRGDSEDSIARLFAPPAARSWALDAWTSVARATPDSALDRLAGARGPARFDSSGRFENQPRYRASAAFDGTPGRAWVGDYVPGGAPAWLGWSTPAPITVRRLTLAPPVLPVRVPTRVRLRWPRGATRPLAVAPSGVIALPTPVRARSFRLDVLAADFRSPATASQRRQRAVAIGELRVPGLPGLAPPSPSRPLAAPCGLARVRTAGGPVRLRPAGTVADLDAGRPLRAQGCDAPAALRAGPQEVRVEPGPLAVDVLRLRSPAPAGPVTASGGGRVVDPGRAGRGRYDGVRLATAGEAWLVLGESFNRGWRAWCDGRSLGSPVPLDAYANGWRLDRPCRRARFAFGPNRPVTWGYWLSALIALVLVVVLVARRPRGRALAPLDRAPLPAPQDARVPLGRAAAIAAGAGVLLGFVFSIRAGVVIVPGLALLLWLGPSTRRLVLAAAALLGVVVPLAYLTFSPPNRHGDDFNYAVDHITAHWVGVAAVVLLLLALCRTLAAARRQAREARGGRQGPATRETTPPRPARELSARG